MKLLKVHTTSRGVEFRVEIHAYNLVMYRFLNEYQNKLRKFFGHNSDLGTTLVTKDDFT